MKIDVDIECSNRTTNCKYDQKCLEDFDNSLCCEIVRESSNYLLVSPVSTFKSTYCSYIRMIESDDKEIPICCCPIRIEIYRKYNI